VIIMMNVLIRGNLITREITVAEAPREEPYIGLANMFNYDHGRESRKHGIPKRWIWFNKEVAMDG